MCRSCSAGSVVGVWDCNCSASFDQHRDASSSIRCDRRCAGIGAVVAVLSTNAIKAKRRVVTTQNKPYRPRLPRNLEYRKRKRPPGKGGRLVVEFVVGSGFFVDGVGGRLQIFASAADGVAGCCGEGHRRDAESEQDFLDHNIFLPKGPVTGVPENVT